MKKDLKKYFKKAIEYSIYFFVIYFIYTKLDGNVQNLLEYDTYSLWLLSVPVLLVSLLTIINGFHWKRLMELEGEKVTLLEQIDVYIQSYILRYIPGNVVGILSRGLLNKKYKVGVLKSIWGWFLENLYYLVVGIVTGSYFVIKRIGLVTSLFDWASKKDVFVFAVIVFLIISVIALAIVVFFKSDLLIKLFNKVSSFLLPKKYKSYKVTDSKIELKGRIELLVRYGFSWIIYSFAFLAVTYAVTGIWPTNPLEISSIWALAYSVGYIFIVTPSGAGVREIVLISLLPAISSYSLTESVIIAVAARVVAIIGELFAYLTIKMILVFKNAKK